MRKAFLLLPMLAVLGGCNYVDNLTGLSKESHKALGASCRQTGRSLEECFVRNPEADKAQLYTGWREMHEYMEKHKLETMMPPPEASPATAALKPHQDGDKSGEDMHKPSSSQTGSMIQPPMLLTDEAADKAVQNDPQVEAVLAAIKSRDKSVSAGTGAGATTPSAVAKPSADEADQKKMLDLIKQLNQTKPNTIKG
jgi:hypothetical protein